MPRDYPELTTCMDVLRKDLDHFGFCLLKDFAPTEQVQALKLRLAEQALAERENKVAQLSDETFWGGQSSDKWTHQIISNLINKGEVFHSLVLEERLREIISWCFRGHEYLLSSYNGTVLRKGGAKQPIHADQQFLRDFTLSPYTANAIVALTDFNSESGGTRMVPFSHRWGRYPITFTAAGKWNAVSGEQPVETIPVEVPAGTAIIFDGRLWHSAGNNLEDTCRYAVSIYYCVGFLRQDNNWAAMMQPNVLASLSDEMKAILGFKTSYGLGRIEPSAEGGITNVFSPLPFVGHLIPRGDIDV